jgi:hypothetical protein
MQASTEQKPVSRARQRLGGIFILAVAVVMATIAWRQAHTQPKFSFAGAFVGPAFAVVGIGLLLWPGYREERIARGEDVSRLEGAALITPRWWAILGVGLVAGAAYTLGLRNGWL